MITGYFDPRFAQPVPLVRVALFLPGVSHHWAAVDFLLDTGADTTLLHPQDATVRVGIGMTTLTRPSSWPHRADMGGVGGTSECYIQPAHYAFRHSDGQWQRITGEVWIAQPSADNQTLESLLGWDLLQYFSISIDWSRGQITLEQQRPGQ